VLTAQPIGILRATGIRPELLPLHLVLWVERELAAVPDRAITAGAIRALGVDPIILDHLWWI